MRRQGTLVIALLVCIGGLVAISVALLEDSVPECPSMTNSEIAMGKSRLGFPRQDLNTTPNPARCQDGRFGGSIAFRERDLTPEDVIEMAAAAGWQAMSTEAETTCFARQRPGWERLQLAMADRGETVDAVEISFNPNGACQQSPQ